MLVYVKIYLPKSLRRRQQYTEIELQPVPPTSPSPPAQHRKPIPDFSNPPTFPAAARVREMRDGKEWGTAEEEVSEFWQRAVDLMNGRSLWEGEEDEDEGPRVPREGFMNKF